MAMRGTPKLGPRGVRVDGTRGEKRLGVRRWLPAASWRGAMDADRDRDRVDVVSPVGAGERTGSARLRGPWPGGSLSIARSCHAPRMVTGRSRPSVTALVQRIPDAREERGGFEESVVRCTRRTDESPISRAPDGRLRFDPRAAAHAAPRAALVSRSGVRRDHGAARRRRCRRTAHVRGPDDRALGHDGGVALGEALLQQRLSSLPVRAAHELSRGRRSACAHESPFGTAGPLDHAATSETASSSAGAPSRFARGSFKKGRSDRLFQRSDADLSMGARSALSRLSLFLAAHRLGPRGRLLPAS